MSENSDKAFSEALQNCAFVIFYTQIGNNIRCGGLMSSFDAVIRSILEQYPPSQAESDIIIKFKADSIDLTIEKKSHKSGGEIIENEEQP